MNSKIIYTYNNKDNELDVLNRISFAEEEDLIDSVVKSLFDEDGMYRPSRMDYFFWSMILGKYTNFDFDKYSANEIYAIIDDSDIRESLGHFISSSQLYRMQCAIDEMVKVRLNEHPFKGVASMIKNAFTDSSGAIHKILTDENFRSQLTKYINSDDKSALASALNEAAYHGE